MNRKDEDDSHTESIALADALYWLSYCLITHIAGKNAFLQLCHSSYFEAFIQNSVCQVDEPLSERQGSRKIAAHAESHRLRVNYIESTALVGRLKVPVPPNRFFDHLEN